MGKKQFLTLNDALSVVRTGADAHALRQFNFMNKSLPASVGDLLRELGFGCRFEAMPHAVSGKLVPDTWAEKSYEVVLNSRHPRLRQRFSALHEVGHYYLHVDPCDPLAPVKHRATGDTLDQVYDLAGMLEESEANQWADAVIFGNHALEGALGLYGRDLDALSRHFAFSKEVVERALKRRGF
ncbi:ImmA/IrrE family metallo-endopeptidase [Tabrizicola sp. YIM 78059]|uniref:ImmA/IrrE family metallo-endopeptidase n=1 Tax=Tabrizicola sp. YIM 78059 TaxID=2529861 RepID=UPI0020BE3909|nr:ImmA/IrrE family metallo-endopeptidase [Tabrizicola sp. YIM 78059]